MPQELVNLYFDNNFVDSTDRHTFTNTGVIIAPSEVSSACAQFDGQSYLSTDNNLSDFLLGATPNPHTWTGQPPLSIFNDNNFTFDCWIYPELGGARYYPICSSFASEYWGASYKTGWSIQLDTATGHLQMIGYYGNLWTNCLLEYNFQIVFNQWTHISIMSWRVTGQSAPSAKIVFKKALENNATSLILCHNHPSGNLSPSQADIDVTKKLKQAGTLMGIDVHDHIIVANTGYYSFADNSLL